MRESEYVSTHVNNRRNVAGERAQSTHGSRRQQPRKKDQSKTVKRVQGKALTITNEVKVINIT